MLKFHRHCISVVNAHWTGSEINQSMRICTESNKKNEVSLFLYRKCYRCLNNCWQIDRIDFFFNLSKHRGWILMPCWKIYQNSQIKTVTLELQSTEPQSQRTKCQHTVGLAVGKCLKIFTRNRRLFLCWCILNFRKSLVSISKQHRKPHSLRSDFHSGSIEPTIITIIM